MAEKNSLWKNIRKKAEQNRRTGAKPKKPTAEMLRQERKIKAKQKADGGYLYAEGGQYLTVDGEYHRVYRNADGDIAVNHPKEDKGKWDTINLTDKSGANTISEGIASVRKWHRENPSYATGGYMYPDGGKTKVYTNPSEFKKAERAYNDSLSAYKAGKDFFDDFSNSSNTFKRVTPNQYHIEAAKDIFNTNINPSEIYEDPNSAADIFIPLWKKPEIKPVLEKPTVDKLQSKQYSNFSSNQQPSIVGNVENISPSEINMDNFYEGQYEKYRRSPYEDPMYRVWVPGQQMQIVPEEQFKKLNDEYALKDLNQKSYGGYMYDGGGGVNPGKQKAVASTTDVSVRALPEGLFEQVKANPPARQPQTISVVDKRKQNPITKKPINPNRDLVGGKFEDTIPIEIIKSSYKHGVDPATALSIGLLESRMGTTDPNVGHVMVDPYSDYMPGAEDMVLTIKEKQDYAKKLGYTDPLLQLQAYNGLGVLSNKRGEIGKSAYGLPIPKEGIDLRQNPLYGKKVKNVRDSVIMQSPDLVRLMNYYKPKMDGGYMYYTGGPMEYKVGGKVWKHIGAGAYALGEGILDTVTMGATDQLTDKGFEWLTKVGNKNIDLSNPDDVKFLKTQQQIKGYSNAAGAIGTAVVTGNVQGAISQGTKGLNTAFQASDWASDDFKKWSQGISGVAGMAAGFAGGLNSDSFNAAAKAGTGVAGFGQKAGKIGSFGNQVTGMFGGNQQPLWQQGEARQEYLNSPEYLAMKEKQNQAYVNQGLSFASTGGNINNSLNLQNSMRGKYNSYKRKYSKGGTFQKYGINEIPDSAGYHHENAYGGVPIGPNAMAEGGEFVLDNNYVVSDEVDGMNTQTDEFGRTMAQNLKRDLSKYTMRDLDSKHRDSPRRPMDPLPQETINQIKQKAMMETEMARAEAQAKEQERQAMVDGALQYAAAGGKLNKDLEEILSNDIQSYVEADNYYAYGGYLPKDKGFNMPNSYAKGGSIHIKKSKRGTFTAAAKKHGKSVQEFARQVLANKGNYSSAMVKKANFARNAAKWKHAEGGPMDPPDRFDSYWRKSDSTEYAQRGLRDDIMKVANSGVFENIDEIESARKFGYNPSAEEMMDYYRDYGRTERGKFEKARVEGQAGALKDYQNNKYLSLTNQDVIDLAERVIDNNGSYIFEGSMASGSPKANLEKTLNKLDLNRVKSMVDFKMKNKSTGGNIYAHGGPVVSNVPQDFDLYAQNRGGMMMAQGGNMYFGGGGVDPNIIGPIDYSFHMPTGSDVIEDLPGFTFDPSVTNKVSNNALGLNNPNFAFVNPAVYNNEISEIQDLPGYTPSVSVSDEAIGLNQNYSSVFNPDLPKLDFTQSDVKKYGLDPNNVNVIPDPKSTTPWYEEPWYSKAARYAPLLASAAGIATGIQNKKRKLPYRNLDTQTVNYEPERIIDREESRRRYNTFADRMKNIASSAGMLAGNLRGTLLGSNKELAGRIAESVMREENTNAQLAQQTGMAQFAANRETDALNEQMFQNAQTMALRAGQEGAMALQGAAEQERAQYLQEWLAKNRMNTRSYQLGETGDDLYVRPDGTIVDKSGNIIGNTTV